MDLQIETTKLKEISTFYSESLDRYKEYIKSYENLSWNNNHDSSLEIDSLEKNIKKYYQKWIKSLTKYLAEEINDEYISNLFHKPFEYPPLNVNYPSEINHELKEIKNKLFALRDIIFILKQRINNNNTATMKIHMNGNVEFILPDGSMKKCKFSPFKNDFKFLSMFVNYKRKSFEWNEFENEINKPREHSDSPNIENRVRDILKHIQKKLGITAEDSKNFLFEIDKGPIRKFKILI